MDTCLVRVEARSEEALSSHVSRARRLVHHGLADRAGQQPADLTHAARADHQQPGLLSRLQQSGARGLTVTGFGVGAAEAGEDQGQQQRACRGEDPRQQARAAESRQRGGRQEHS